MLCSAATHARVLMFPLIECETSSVCFRLVMTSPIGVAIIFSAKALRGSRWYIENFSPLLAYQLCKNHLNPSYLYIISIEIYVKSTDFHISYCMQTGKTFSLDLLFRISFESSRNSPLLPFPYFLLLFHLDMRWWHLYSQFHLVINCT